MDFSDDNTRRQQVESSNFIFKTVHAYFEHRIFSKFFGGKIQRIWADIIYRTNNEKIGTCALLSWRENCNFLSNLNHLFVFWSLILANEC